MPFHRFPEKHFKQVLTIHKGTTYPLPREGEVDPYAERRKWTEKTLEQIKRKEMISYTFFNQIQIPRWQYDENMDLYPFISVMLRKIKKFMCDEVIEHAIIFICEEYNGEPLYSYLATDNQILAERLEIYIEENQFEQVAS